MERVVSATEARAHFGEITRRIVEDKEAVIVERDGRPQIVLVFVVQNEQYKALQQEAEPEWKDLMRQAHEAIERDLCRRPLPPADENMRQAGRLS